MLFRSLPGGSRGPTYQNPTSATFNDLSYYGNFWTSETGPMPNSASAWHLDYADTWLNEAVLNNSNGFSVRLIKN